MVDFSDPIVITENDIIHVDKNGVTCLGGGFIDFRECARNFAETEKVGATHCVAPRDKYKRA
jgi:hypothetical protein